MSPGIRTAGIAPPRFNVAVQILVRLAGAGGVCPSAEIASQVQGHATFLRRVLAPLVQAGIVEAREGRVGGYSLARPAEKISLADVYVALKAGAALPDQAEHEDEPGHSGRGERLRSLLGEVLARAEEQVLGFLNKVTIADLARQLES